MTNRQSRFFTPSYLPPANEVWGKVMFLHLCVILFKGEGGSDQPPDADPPGVVQTPPQGWADLPRCRPPGVGQLPKIKIPLGLCRPPPPQGWADPPDADLPEVGQTFLDADPPYGKQAGGTHPTGMLSCCCYFLL